MFRSYSGAACTAWFAQYPVSVRSGVLQSGGRCGRFGSPPRDPPERRRFRVPRIPEGLVPPDEGPVRAVGAPGHGGTGRRPCRPGEACRIPRPRWRTRGRCTARHGRNGARDRPRRHARRPHDTACSGARGPPPPVSMAVAHDRPASPRASTSAGSPCSRSVRWPCARRRCRPRAAGPGAPPRTTRPARPGPPPAPLAGLVVTGVPPRRTPPTPGSRTTSITRPRPVPAGSRPCADDRARVLRHPYTAMKKPAWTSRTPRAGAPQAGPPLERSLNPSTQATTNAVPGRAWPRKEADAAVNIPFARPNRATPAREPLNSAIASPADCLVSAATMAPVLSRQRRSVSGAAHGSLVACSTAPVSDEHEPRDSVNSPTAYALNSGAHPAPFAMVPSPPIEPRETRNKKTVHIIINEKDQYRIYSK
ncbi:hypothetical protein BLJ_1880 [Bifidobacterium longum subsp. longum JDM301]|uniref:Uncharacterized protein n=1 Tax=Bifidobacterium longum subsp. longum (strain JDM301) TaxID=759350 RepID=D6ZWP6_BIFLJ|nr:hypothetical protein BLJ_1880 [Bifidobacterium longum subsp. longum JDM301]